MARELARYEAESGGEIVLTDVDVRRVLTDNQNVTDAEMKLFIELCKAQRLNPFIREAYIVKYGNAPATIITGKDVFLKRAYRNPRFRGLDAGVTVIASDGMAHRKRGSAVYPGEKLLGGWCSVRVEGYDEPMFDEVSFEEYNTGKSGWKRMPGTMVRKVAICHALREAFPEDFGGLYDGSEMGVEEPQEPIEADIVGEEEYTEVF